MMPTISMPSITSHSLGRIRTAGVPWADLLVVVSLIGLDVGARILPHAPNFTPVAASALFAASVLRVRALSLLVPLVAMLLADTVLGSYDWRIMAVIYGALVLPACAGCLSPRLRRPRMAFPVLLSSSLIFFLVSNFAVWAFSPMYAANASGLVRCYVAALPFLQYNVAGDLFWGLVLFGGCWLWQNLRAPSAAIANASLAAAQARP